jgi:CheY-like chemotaxis protein
MYTILVVDDDEQISDLISIVCRPLPVQIISAYTGNDGLALAKQYQPTIIVVDLLLPGKLNGWETIELIQSDPQLHHTPIIVLTATGAALDHDNGVARYEAFFKKPFAPKELRDCIQHYLR